MEIVLLLSVNRCG